MRPPSKETLRRMDQELAGIGFTEEELQKIALQVAWLTEEALALDEIDLTEVEPTLTYSFEVE